jgi:hypothetical protein
MPCHFEFDQQNRLLRVRMEGLLTTEAVREHFQDAGRYVLLTRPSASIWDLSAVTSLEISTDALAKLARSVPALPEPDRPRVIIAASAHVFGLARMFQSLGEGARPRLRVVHSLEEACATLAVSRPSFQPLPPLDSNPASAPAKP